MRSKERHLNGDMNAMQFRVQMDDEESRQLDQIDSIETTVTGNLFTETNDRINALFIY